eukprot:TRINITY_DN2535_c0_g1_i1.p1 TRINITY_DN2535_c0_g1~~TRINITY_DN2535_c0_g1_i1.p1  ORF type:complete len:570 (+),score=130.07 TRINITY_DN2535_c0_g1_i1:27-1712(+)
MVAECLHFGLFFFLSLFVTVSEGSTSGGVGTCPTAGPRASPANVVPSAAKSWDGSLRLQYEVWNRSSLHLEDHSSSEDDGSEADRPSTLNLVFQGAEGGGMAQVGKRFSDLDEYVLRKIRIACPSEHTVLDRKVPMEVQLWHEPTIHRDLYRLGEERSQAQQMLQRFETETASWYDSVKHLEAPSGNNRSFPSLKTERDWADAAQADIIQDGEALLTLSEKLRRQIAVIDEKTATLNARLQRPDAARVVVLSLLFLSPHELDATASEAAPAHFASWLANTARELRQQQQQQQQQEAAARAAANHSTATSQQGSLKQNLSGHEELNQLDAIARGQPVSSSLGEVSENPSLRSNLRRNLQAEDAAAAAEPESTENYEDVEGRKPAIMHEFDFESLRPVGKDLEGSLSQAAFMYDGGFTRPPCTPVVRWFIASEPLAARAQDLLALAGLLPGHLLMSDKDCIDAGHAGDKKGCRAGINPSDGVWWDGPVKETPEVPQKFPVATLGTASLGFGAFHKPPESHLSTEMVSQLPWPYIQASCAILLICSVMMLGMTCGMWSLQCCDQ